MCAGFTGRLLLPPHCSHRSNSENSNIHLKNWPSRIRSKRRSVTDPEKEALGLSGVVMLLGVCTKSRCQAPGSIWQLFSLMHPFLASGATPQSRSSQRLYLEFLLLEALLELPWNIVNALFFLVNLPCTPACLHYCTFHYLRGKSGEFSNQYFCSGWLVFCNRRLSREVTEVGNSKGPLPFLLSGSASQSWKVPLRHPSAPGKHQSNTCEPDVNSCMVGVICDPALIQTMLRNGYKWLHIKDKMHSTAK